MLKQSFDDWVVHWSSAGGLLTPQAIASQKVLSETVNIYVDKERKRNSPLVNPDLGLIQPPDMQSPMLDWYADLKQRSLNSLRINIDPSHEERTAPSIDIEAHRVIERVLETKIQAAHRIMVESVIKFQELQEKLDRKAAEQRQRDRKLSRKKKNAGAEWKF